MIFDEIWRAEWNRKKTVRFYDKGIKQCRAKKDLKGADEWEREASSVVGDIDTGIQIMTSRALVRQAHKLHVPVPEYSDEQSWENVWGSYVLLPRAYTALRSQIRQENKERRESWIAWVKDVIVPVGGILISLASLMIAYRAVQSRADNRQTIQQASPTPASGARAATPQPQLTEQKKK